MKLYDSRYKDAYYMTYATAFQQLDETLMDVLSNKTVVLPCDGYNSDLRHLMVNTFIDYNHKMVISKGSVDYFGYQPSLTVDTLKEGERKIDTHSVGWHNQKFNKYLGYEQDDIFVIAYLNGSFSEFARILNVSKASFIVGVPSKKREDAEKHFFNLGAEHLKTCTMFLWNLAHDKNYNILKPLTPTVSRNISVDFYLKK